MPFKIDLLHMRVVFMLAVQRDCLGKDFLRDRPRSKHFTLRARSTYFFLSLGRYFKHDKLGCHITKGKCMKMFNVRMKKLIKPMHMIKLETNCFEKITDLQ